MLVECAFNKTDNDFNLRLNIRCNKKETFRTYQEYLLIMAFLFMIYLAIDNILLTIKILYSC